MGRICFVLVSLALRPGIFPERQRIDWRSHGRFFRQFSARKNLKIAGELAGIPVGRYGDAVRGEAAVKYLPTHRLGFTIG